STRPTPRSLGCRANARPAGVVRRRQIVPRKPSSCRTSTASGDASRRPGTSFARLRSQMSHKLRNLWRMATGPVRGRGVVATVRSVRSCMRARARARDDPFDAPWGTDTERTVRVADLDASGPDVPALWRYWPTSRATFDSIMRDVDIAYERSLFVDLGSGKG